MDFVNKLANSQSGDKKHEGGSNSSGGGIGDKLNSMAGGGSKGEKNEDLLDKGIDYVQEKYLKGGDQSNESAAEQAKDKKIAGFIRDQYKGATGKEFPIKEKNNN